MSKAPVLKAFACWIDGERRFGSEYMVWARNAAQARKKALADFSGHVLIDIRVLRAPEHDKRFAPEGIIPDWLTDDDISIIIHAFCGDSADPRNWGNRSFYYAESDGGLNRLVNCGIFEGSLSRSTTSA